MMYSRSQQTTFTFKNKQSKSENDKQMRVFELFEQEHHYLTDGFEVDPFAFDLGQFSCEFVVVKRAGEV